MKELTPTEWEKLKKELFSLIKDTPDNTFDAQSIRLEIKRKIPINTKNKEEILNSINEINIKWMDSIYMGGGIKSHEIKRLIKLRAELEYIINNIELEQIEDKKENLVKEKLNYFHLKPNFFGLGLNLNKILEKIIQYFIK